MTAYKLENEKGLGYRWILLGIKYTKNEAVTMNLC